MCFGLKYNAIILDIIDIINIIGSGHSTMGPHSPREAPHVCTV